MVIMMCFPKWSQTQLAPGGWGGAINCDNDYNDNGGDDDDDDDTSDNDVKFSQPKQNLATFSQV